MTSGAVLHADVLRYVERSVLCWLATVDSDGWPSVSPKEVFAALDSNHLVIANIASPGSIRNIRHSPPVTVSFIDIFVQRGYKVKGLARVIEPHDIAFPSMAAPLEAMTQGIFPIHSVICVEAKRVEPIVAPRYRLFPDDTTEASQQRNALATYGVQWAIQESLRENDGNPGAVPNPDIDP